MGKERRGLWVPRAESTPAVLWEVFEGRGIQGGGETQSGANSAARIGDSLDQVLLELRAPGTPGCRRPQPTLLGPRAGLSISSEGQQCLPVAAALTAALERNGAATGEPSGPGDAENLPGAILNPHTR